MHKQGHMCIYLQDMKFLWSKLSLGWLYTDANDDNTNDTDDDDNDTRRTEYDCIGSLPNEPKKAIYQMTHMPTRLFYLYRFSLILRILIIFPIGQITGIDHIAVLVHSNKMKIFALYLKITFDS